MRKNKKRNGTITVGEAINKAKQDVKRTRMKLLSPTDLFSLAQLYMMEDLIKAISS